MSIPKVIHYFWFGHSELPDIAVKCIESWKKYCPDYEIKRWDEDNFDFSDCPYAVEAYNDGKYAFVTDYARLKVLYELGGVYLDTDVELIKPIDELMEFQGFAGFEKGGPTPYGRGFFVATGLGLGSVAGHSVIKALIDDYKSISFFKENKKADLTACPERNTEVLRKLGLKCDNTYQIIDGLVIMPTEYLSPSDWVTGKCRITKNTFAIHHYLGSWKKNRVPLWKMRLKCTRLGMLIMRIKYTGSLRGRT